jgi:hypothetical protein
MQPVVPIAGNATDPHWTIEELLDRVGRHDFHMQEWEVLATAVELVGAGRVRAIGRPCDAAGQPSTQWEPIPAHAMRDLVIPPRPRGQPQHPGDMFWRGSGKRAYAFVQFNAIDLEREWLAELFARPRHEAPADIVIPPTERPGDEGLVEAPPAPAGPSVTNAAEDTAFIAVGFFHMLDDMSEVEVYQPDNNGKLAKLWRDKGGRGKDRYLRSLASRYKTIPRKKK